MIDVQIFLSSKEKRFFANINKFIAYSAFMAFWTWYLCIIFHEANWLYSFAHNYYFALFLLIVNFVLSLSTWLLGTAYAIFKVLKNDLIKLRKCNYKYVNFIHCYKPIKHVYQKYYPNINLITWLLWIISIPIYNSLYISNLIKHDALSERLLQCLITNFLLCLFFFGTYQFYLFQSKIYRKSLYKIATIKTRQGEIFNNLYLYSHDDKNLFLGSESVHSNSGQFLVISKDVVEYYLIEIEIYKWDKKIYSNRMCSIPGLNIEKPAYIIKP